ncbi:unnamed protein product [Didymodactylos carnosus]|uniref:Uncharacterized protein n=1 Tax=Didymodactylos carnosus TaxID=1234261 RepID=A0A8S2SYQ4_9BILA|nr:unnamed protein product [Didymodactylos carnosus]CAF4252249.1 unnamed protein product [Didymodactylos carnosus]
MKEMRFKYWLPPNAEECYHEVLDAGATLYFMYEILNADTHDSSIVSYVRHKNGTILSVATTPQRGHLEVKLDDTKSMRAIDSIASHIMVSRQSQIEIEMLAQKDSYLIEMNYRWVQYWALIHLGLIIGYEIEQTKAFVKS